LGMLCREKLGRKKMLNTIENHNLLSHDMGCYSGEVGIMYIVIAK
jgi:hypothetical protein